MQSDQVVRDGVIPGQTKDEEEAWKKYSMEMQLRRDDTGISICQMSSDAVTLTA